MAVLEKVKWKVKKIWREKSKLQLSDEDAMDEKDMEITRLKAHFLAVTSPGSLSIPVGSDHRTDKANMVPLPHSHGKAPPFDPFRGEGLDEHWDEWLLTFERAAEWNNWNDSEYLLQLTDHLRGKARQEFSLLTSDEKSTFSRAKITLMNRLEVSSKALGAQDLRHTTQGSQESVSDYILGLEKTFRRAYGSDPMAEETRYVLLYAQLQEGLKYVLMKAPAVSGARGYKEPKMKSAI